MATYDTLADRLKAEADHEDTAIRRPELMRALFEVLELQGPMPAKAAITAVRDHLPLTDVELSTNKSGAQRFDTFLRFVSFWGAKIGWISKSHGWGLTDAGRDASSTYDDEDLYRELTKRYRDALAKEKKAAWTKDPTANAIRDVLAVIGEGEWAKYAAVGELAGTTPQVVGRFVNTVPTESGHRLLLVDARCGEDFQWADGREASQREVLQSEGIEFDSSGRADERAELRLEDLRERLEELGVVGPAPRRAWLVRGSSVNGRDLIPVWRDRGSVSLPATKLRPVEPGASRETLKPIVEDDYSQASYAAKAAKVDEFHAFLTRMQAGDLVATTSQGRLYLGTITGDPAYVVSDDGRSNLRRAVDWLDGDGVDYADVPNQVSARLQVQHEVVEMTQQLGELEAMLVQPSDEPALEPEPVVELTLPDATDELADKLHVDRAWLQESIQLLRDRKQLIYYGPPGTGKTYLALKLAEHLAGDNVRLVQFHPAYTYEDFFEGYRPMPSGGFELRPGPLRKIVDQAKENPSTPYFLIIDEINRGNLAKIFGELYFLLEYRDREIDLLYATDDDVGFTLPGNVFVIGTMNTADRSIALVDSAMRRRFAFEALHPSSEPTAGLLRRWLEAEDLPGDAADLLEALNARIEDPDFKIGPSYFMKAGGQTPEGLERTWRTSILPLLEEHHFGDLDAEGVAKRYGLATIRARVPNAGSDGSDGQDDAPDPD